MASRSYSLTVMKAHKKSRHDNHEEQDYFKNTDKNNSSKPEERVEFQHVL